MLWSCMFLQPLSMNCYCYLLLDHLRYTFLQNEINYEQNRYLPKIKHEVLNVSLLNFKEFGNESCSLLKTERKGICTCSREKNKLCKCDKKNIAGQFNKLSGPFDLLVTGKTVTQRTVLTWEGVRNNAYLLETFLYMSISKRTCH